MSQFEIIPPSEQVFLHLRTELLRGKWSIEMPGAPSLASELGVDRKTVVAGLCKLEEEGFLLQQGIGRRRRIVIPDAMIARALRICLMTYTDEDNEDPKLLDLLHRIQAAGHVASFADQSVFSLMSHPRRLERCIKKAEADAWVIYGGSREVLGKFAESKLPTFALAGRMRGVPISGVKPDKVAAITTAVRRLITLGHRRIVNLVLPERVTPAPGFAEQQFLNEIAAFGIPTGAYNLAVWDGSMKGFYARIDSLLQHTPPTALFLNHSSLFIAAQHHLARRGILAPENISLISTDPDPYFGLLEPSPAHIQWSFNDLSRRVERWVNNIARGRDDRRQTYTKATFVEGETIGSV